MMMVLRYGFLLALFLVVLDVARRSFLMRSIDTEIYIILIAIIFLGFGGWLALKIFRPIERQDIEASGMRIRNIAGFSDREAEVLLFLCHGYTNKEIAAQLEITINTVKSHLKNIYVKLGVSNRTQAAAEAKMLDIIGS